VLAATLLVACGPATGSTTRPIPPGPLDPDPAPTLAPTDLAYQAAQARLDAVFDGLVKPQPLPVTWDDIAAGIVLPDRQNKAFCDALDRPGVDDGLGKLVALGLNALSLRLRHKPLPDDAEDVLGIAATFATKSCPAWIPVIRPPQPAAPTPAPPWVPFGYFTVIGDPDLAYRFAPANTYTCNPGFNRCWRVDVVARYGCTRLQGDLAVKNADDVVLEYDSRVWSDIPVNEPWTIDFGTSQTASTSGELMYLTCSR
jgi:hypothetical protein